MVEYKVEYMVEYMGRQRVASSRRAPRAPRFLTFSSMNYSNN